MTNPFRLSVPKARFLALIQVPGAGILLVALLLAGAVSNLPYFHDVQVRSLGERIDEAVGSSLPLPPAAAAELVGGTIRNLVRFPEVCLKGRAVNDFQIKQCENFKERLKRRGLLAVIPFALFALFIWFTVGWIDGVYRRAAKAFDEKKAKFGGVITDPAEAPGDLFSRVADLRSIGVQVKAGTQIVIYLHRDEPIPLPGQTYAILEMGQALGAMRYTGILYAPHLAVISGSR